MIINKLIINRFGKLIDKTFELDKNYNVFVWPNGEGKTTLFNFIRVMFYGIAPTRKNTTDSLRNKYIPWNETKAYGSIKFEVNGESYLLERTFYRTKTRDHSQLYNLKNGEQITVNDENYGLYFFHIDEDVFLNTIYIFQKELQMQANSNLKDALINTFQTGNIATSYESAIDFIHEIEKKNNLARAGTYLYKKQEQLMNINRQIQAVEKKNQLICDLISENENLLKEQKELMKQIDFLTNIKNYYKLKEKNELLKRYEQLKERYEEKKSMDEQNVDYDALDKKAQELMSIPSDIRNFGFHIILMFLIFVAAVTFSILYSPYFCFLIVLDPFIFWYLLSERKKDKQVKEQRKEECLAYFRQFHCENYQEFSSFISLNKAKYKLFSSSNIVKEYERFCALYPIETLIIGEQFKEDKELEKYKIQEHLLEEYKERVQQLNEEMATNRGKIYSLEDDESYKKILYQKEELEAEILKGKQERQSCILAKEVIDEVKKELGENYLPSFKDVFLRILNDLSKIEFKNVVVDNEFNVFLDEGNQLHNMEFYSQGFKDLIYFALRMSVVQMAYNDESLPLFLDDPFVNLDPENMKKVLAYLKKQSANQQIVLFTCYNHDNLI